MSPTLPTSLELILVPLAPVDRSGPLALLALWACLALVALVALWVLWDRKARPVVLALPAKLDRWGQ